METRSNKRNLAWGMLLIVFGVVALLDSFFGLDDMVEIGLIALGGVVTLLFFFTDRKDWVLLVPPYILLATAGIAYLVINDMMRDSIIATVVLVLIALPFLAVFLLNRANWWALIPGWVLLTIGVMVFLLEENLLTDNLVPMYVLSSIGLPFLVVYLMNRANWWALIPAYSLLAVGTMVTLIVYEVLLDFAIPAYIMFAIAIPFLFVFLVNRSQRWALIPGGILAALGFGFFTGTDLGRYVIPAVLVVAGGWLLYQSLIKKE